MTVYRLPLARRTLEKRPGVGWFDTSELSLIDDELELRVICLRAGMEGGKQHTYPEIAEIIDRCPENVRELQNRAMYKINRRREEDQARYRQQRGEPEPLGPVNLFLPPGWHPTMPPKRD